MSARLDHLVVAARTLEEGRAWLENRLGAPLHTGGEHPTFGTHNLLLSLGSSYLEVIALNPAAPQPPRPRWFELDTPAMQRRLSAGPALIHWVAAVDQLPPDSALLSPGVLDSGVLGSEVLELTRGDNRWQLTVPADGSLPLGGVAPSLIRWHTPAPATRLPGRGVRLTRLRLGTPQPDLLRDILKRIDFTGEVATEAVEVYEARQTELRALLLTPNGPAEL
ncbi:VOC family protein [Deinococcus sp.]|uniref:VOC family protein n=1 Tax=Deinococcus sp. TaxID=47478 RepID=UPI0025C607F2|nr:VOC family protein [Deinococcus sp.]